MTNPRHYQMEFRALYTGTIEVEAESEDEARELAKDDMAGTGWAFESDDMPYVELESVTEL